MDLGFSELFALAIIGVLLLGPKELARVSYKFGAWMREVRKVSQDFIMELKREGDLLELRERARELEREIGHNAFRDEDLRGYHGSEPEPGPESKPEPEFTDESTSVADADGATPEPVTASALATGDESNSATAGTDSPKEPIVAARD